MTRVTSCLALALLSIAAFVGIGCGPVKRPDGGQGLLPVGADAPEVVGRDAEQHEVRLTALKGRPVVVYFYPQDGTPGCTKEACAFRDAWKRLESADVQVIGVSTNSATSHEDFQKKQHLPFALASDDGKVGDAYGVSKHVWGFDRVSFLVGRDGKVAHVWPAVDPAVHADEVVREASRL
jgi:thioredoxin-dependent peroxiredoxin